MKFLQKITSKSSLIIIGIILLLGTGTAFAYPLAATTIYLPVVHGSQPTPPPVTQFVNPSFEQGTLGWVVTSNQSDLVVTTAAARTGVYSAGLGNGNNRVTSIAQQVVVPQQAYVVQYWQWVESLELCSDTKNVVTVYVNGSPYQHYKICQDANNSKWIEKRIHLQPYKGQTIVFRLEFNSSTILHNYLYVDDFSFGVP